MRFRQKILSLTLCLAATSATAADVLSERDAKAALFSTKAPVLAVATGLSDKDKSTLKALLPIMQDRLALEVGYYGAMAFSPTDGLVSDSLQGALNYHVVTAAEAAALAACEAAKSSGAAACIVAAQILPRGYKASAFTLSQSATEDFNTGYARARGARVFAISPSTGAWGWNANTAEAMTTCAAKGATDCRIAVQD